MRTVTLFKMFDKIHRFNILSTKIRATKNWTKIPALFLQIQLSRCEGDCYSIDVPYLANFIKILMSHGLGIFIYILIRRIDYMIV